MTTFTLPAELETAAPTLDMVRAEGVTRSSTPAASSSRPCTVSTSPSSAARWSPSWDRLAAARPPKFALLCNAARPDGPPPESTGVARRRGGMGRSDRAAGRVQRLGVELADQTGVAASVHTGRCDDLPRMPFERRGANLNWVITAAPMSPTTMTLIDYIPYYRSLAGTEHGVAFGYRRQAVGGARPVSS